MQSAQNQRYFKISEAAKLLGLSSETLRRWEKAGKFSFSRSPGGKRLFSEADLEIIRNLLKPTQVLRSTLKPARNVNVNPSERIILLSIPRVNFPKVNFNLAKTFVALVILVLLFGNIFFFSKTSYSKQAVLGVETFIAPAIAEEGPIGNILSSGGKILGNIGNFFKNVSFVVPLVGTSELSTSGDLEVKGQGHFAKDLKIDGVATVGKLVTGIVDPYLIENDGKVQSSLEIKTTHSSLGRADIVFKPGGLEKLRIKEEGTVKVSTSLEVGGDQSISGNLILSSTSPVVSIGNTGTLKITDGTNTLLKLTDNGTTGNLETSGDLKVSGNITLSGSINSNTLTSTSLVFAGSSPSIYAATTNTGISLNANGTGAISIGNSSTGDIYLGGGTTSGTRCFVSNSTGNFTCSGTGTFSSLSTTSVTSITSTATSGDIFSVIDTSLSGAGSNLGNFTFKNNNTGAGVSINGITVTEQAAATPSSGTNTSNLINLVATANGTVNGINILSATGFTNFFKTPSVVIDSTGNLSGVGTFSAGAGSLTSVAATGNINSSSGSLQTNGVTRLDNSGNLTAGTGSFGGSISPSLDATYDLGTAVLRWNNAYFAGDVTAGDVVFKNNFRLTENGDKGIDLLNAKGQKIASFDENGNFWVKGEIKQGLRSDELKNGR